MTDPHPESAYRAPCRDCGAAYAACVDGDPCCQACLHTDAHVESGPDENESMTRYLAMLRDLCPNDAGSDHAWGWQESGDIYWLHICSALEAGWSLGQLDVTSGQRHRVVNRDPLTVEASVLCLGCQDHGWFRDGRWVSA